MSICVCPSSAALTTIPSQECPFDLGQIQKLWFQKRYADGAINTITITNAKLKATWTALLAEDDDTKVVVTPFVEAPTADGGDAITYGGGNDTVGGATKIINRNPVGMTFALRQYTPAIVTAMKDLQCVTDLGVFLINGDGQIFGWGGGTTSAPTIEPIPIQSLFVGDLMPMGYDNPDENALSFSFRPNWSDKLVAVAPTDFDPIDLRPAE